MREIPPKSPPFTPPNMLDLSTPPPQDLIHGKDSLRQPSSFPVLGFCSTLIFVAGLIFGVAEPAFAALKVCHNISSRSSQSIYVAVGYKNKWRERRIRRSRSVIFGPLGLKKSYYIDRFQWISQGWIKIPPNQCKPVLDKDLTEDDADNYYIFAIGSGGYTDKVTNGGNYFCLNLLVNFKIVYNIPDENGISEEQYCNGKGSNYKFTSGFIKVRPDINESTYKHIIS